MTFFIVLKLLETAGASGTTASTAIYTSSTAINRDITNSLDFKLFESEAFQIETETFDFGETVFAKIETNPTSESLLLHVDKCTASQSSDANNEEFLLFDDSSSTDIVTMMTNGDSYYAAFNFEAFSIAGHSGYMWIHCTVRTCYNTESMCAMVRSRRNQVTARLVLLQEKVKPWKVKRQIRKIEYHLTRIRRFIKTTRKRIDLISEVFNGLK